MSKVFTGISFKGGGENGVKISYDSFNDEGKIGDTSKNYKHVPHQHFQDAMQKLKSHLLLISEFLVAEKFKKLPVLDEDDPLGKNFRVCGVHISGEGEKEGVIITGYHTLSTGLGYVFNTPLTKIENEGETKYKFIQDLVSDVEDVRKEAGEYLTGKHGKKSNPNQTELELEPAEKEE